MDRKELRAFVLSSMLFLAVMVVDGCERKKAEKEHLRESISLLKQLNDSKREALQYRYRLDECRRAYPKNEQP